jgi:hypothetical protein
LLASYLLLNTAISTTTDTAGKLIRASMEQLKIEIGWNGPTLSIPYAEFAGLATKCWLRHTWQFMDAHQVWIEDTSPEFLPSRTNDQLLVPLFHEQSIRSLQLHRINLYRLFLQVLHSQISTGYRTMITKTAWNGERKTSQTSCHQWPSQGPPSVQDWVLCRTTLTMVLRLQSAHRLISPLGHLASCGEALSMVFIPPLIACTRNKVMIRPNIPRAPGRPSRATLMKFNLSLGSISYSCYPF